MNMEYLDDEYSRYNSEIKSKSVKRRTLLSPNNRSKFKHGHKTTKLRKQKRNSSKYLLKKENSVSSERTKREESLLKVKEK